MYILLLSTIFAASYNSIFMKKAKLATNRAVFGFNLFGALLWLIIALTLCGGKIELSGAVLLWGIFYGIAQSTFIFFKTAAMNSGPVSVTTLIGNASLVISICFSLIVWNEAVSALDVVGLIVLLIGIYLCTYKKGNATYRPSWKYLVVLFCITAASVGLVFKAFGKSGNLAMRDDMMVIAAATMLVSYAIAYAITRTKEKSDSAPKRTPILYICAVVCGLLSFYYNRCNMSIANAMDAIVFFPAFNGGVVLLSTLLSVWICKEKLARKQLCGIILGILAICVIGVF